MFFCLVLVLAERSCHGAVPMTDRNWYGGNLGLDLSILANIWHPAGLIQLWNMVGDSHQPHIRGLSTHYKDSLLISRCWFQIYFFSTPKIGEMIQFDERAYLSKGLVNNHQLDKQPTVGNSTNQPTTKTKTASTWIGGLGKTTTSKTIVWGQVSWMHGCGEPSFGHSSKSRGVTGHCGFGGRISNS